jgi:hypothetical protein
MTLSEKRKTTQNIHCTAMLTLAIKSNMNLKILNNIAKVLVF